MRVVYFLLTAFLLVGCEEQPIEQNTAVQETVSLGQNELILSEGPVLKKKKETSQSAFYQDETYSYAIEDQGELKIKVRTIQNGDRFVMTQLKNQSPTPLTVRFTVPQNEANDHYLIEWTKNTDPKPHDPVIGVDHTTAPTGLLRYSTNGTFLVEAVISKQFHSRPLTKLYNNGQQSSIREFIQETESLRHTNQGFSFELEAQPKEWAEQWFLLSVEPLFTQTQHLTNWIDFQNKHYQEVNNWFTVNGALKKLPWSTEPFTKNGYGRHLGTLIEKEAIDRYFQLGDRYFYNLMIQSVGNLLEYRQAKGDTIWKTEYTSTWLKQKYEITSPYFDTRYNELIALYLYRIGKEFEDKELMKALPNYADYLLNLIAIDNIVPTANGYLPADYYSPHQGKQYIHTSLNHALGEANLLLDAYQATNNKKYLQAAKQIRLGIESLGTKWIRPNGDLWYQVNRDLTFDGNDYEQLTLQDLQRHEKKWAAIGGKPSPILQKLIKSKQKAIAK